MVQFVSYLRRVLCKPPQKTLYKAIHVFLQLREAIKMYAKLLRGAKMEALTTTLTTGWLPRLFPKWKAPHYLGHPLRGGGGEGGIAKTTNETPIFFSITSNAKMKKEIQIHFSKWCENEKEKRSSNPFFKVRRKTKTVSEIWIPLSYAIEKRLALRYMDWGTSQKTSCVERIVPGNSSTVVSQQLLLIAHDC